MVNNRQKCLPIDSNFSYLLWKGDNIEELSDFTDNKISNTLFEDKNSYLIFNKFGNVVIKPNYYLVRQDFVDSAGKLCCTYSVYTENAFLKAFKPIKEIIE